jgi:hypothetical protein
MRRSFRLIGRAAQVGAIKHWTLIEGSYEAAPDEEATWYIDPPYQRAERTTASGSWTMPH